MIENIRIDTSLSNVFLGLLTTLPLIAFAIISTTAPLFTKRFGIGLTLFAALILLIIGILIRSIDWLPALYLGTVFLGIAIAFGNVLLPSLTKRNFSSQSGLITSFYSSTMAIGASLAAGFSIPLIDEFNFGWRGSLVVWVVLAFIALLVWLPQLWRLKRVNSNSDFLKATKKMFQSSLAWKVAFFMGLQSFTFYVILAWLPAILLSRGYDAQFSGWMLSLSQATGILGSLIIPFLAGKRNDQRGIVIFLVIIESIGLLGLVIPNEISVSLWVTLIGFVLGGTFGLALLFIVLRSKDVESTTELSGMAQSIGYLIAAIGPILIGRIFDMTNNWNIPLILLVVVASIKLFMGLAVGKQGNV